MALNISNVGYGVSQVLPVVVEMLTRPKGQGFAIQQPEVHPHPRAQAALGELIHFLVVDQQHNYTIETHSEFLIDRFRLRMKERGKPKDAQVIFFERLGDSNKAHVLAINDKGQYPREQPDSFRRFFINEEVGLLKL
jgi:predicted ATPase